MIGPLTQRVLEYEKVMKGLVPTVESPADWQPLAEFVAVDSFARNGTFMEHQDWKQYTDMLTNWARAIDSFETKMRRVAEAPPRVYFEIEEQHRRGNQVDIVNSMTVFEFDAESKICHLEVYLQKGR